MQFANSEDFFWATTKEGYRSWFEGNLSPSGSEQCRLMALYAWILLQQNPVARVAMTSALRELIEDTTPPTDSDMDLLSDSDEIGIYHTDPNNGDTDGDGIRDGDEVLGTYGHPITTDPTKWDTDGDGVDDNTEISFGFDPNDFASVPNLSSLSPPALLCLAMLLLLVFCSRVLRSTRSHENNDADSDFRSRQGGRRGHV